MSDLRRLAERDPQFARFVSATRQVRPRPTALQGLLEKLPASAGDARVPVGAPSNPRGWALFAGAGACVIAAAILLTLPREGTPEAASPTRRIEKEARTSGSDDTIVTAPTSSEGVAVHAFPTLRVEDLPGAAPSARREAPARSSAQPKSLAREIELISAAREALTRGDPVACLDAVSAHEHEFPNGQFTLEAHAMRVEATAARGDRSHASELAREFLAKNPRSPYEARIRSLLSTLEIQ